MSVVVDDIEIMRRAVNNFRLWEESLEGVRPRIKDKCALNALKVAFGRLAGTIKLLDCCIRWENEARKKGGEK